MANRYWVGGAGSWTTSDTTHWSTFSGGGGGASVPTASDNVFFDQVATYTVTVTGALACLDFTVSFGVVAFALSGSSSVAISGSMTLASGTVSSWAANFGVTFNATTSKSVSTNNVAIGATTFNGVGGTWTLGSAFSVNNGTLTLTNGTFSTSASNYAVNSANFSSNNSNTRTLNLNASTYTLTSTSWTCITATNLTVSGSGATVTMIGASAKTFSGGSANWGAITLDQGGAGRLTISGSNTFAGISNSYNATGATSIRFTSGTTQTVTSFTAAGTAGKVLTIDSTTPATAATLSKASGTVSVDYVSIQDSTATGGATWNAGSNSTNVSGNTGWVFTDRYWVGGAGNWTTSDTTHWSLTSGGAGGASVPTASNSVFFDQAGTYTVTVTGPLTCRDFTVSAGVVTFSASGNQAIAISGSMSLASGTVGTWDTSFIPTFNATTSQTITTNSESIAATTFDGVGGTWTLGSAFVTSGLLTLTNGTFDTSASNYAVNCQQFSSNNSNIRTLNVNASIFTITTSSWTCTTATNLTVLGSGATVKMAASVVVKTFAGGGANWGAITLDQGGSTRLTISGSNTFANISNSYNATGATSIRFTSGTTQTVTSFTATGSSGKVLTIDSTTPGTAATLSKASGTVSVSFLSIQDSTATGGATWIALDSIDVSGNTGWVITPPIRYWVGGAGTWDASDTTHWSSSSGGAGGATVPYAGVGVIFDQAGTYTVSVDDVFCNDFTISAGLVTFNAVTGFRDITISGNMLVASGTVSSWSTNVGAIFNATTSKTITTNNFNIGRTDFDGVGGTWTLGSNFSCTGSGNGGVIFLINGTFSTSASNYAVNCRTFYSDYSSTRTLNVNASTFTITTSWTCTTATGLTVSGSGATVTMTSASAKTFSGGSANYGAFTLDQGGAGALTISGSNTFANISNSYNATAATSIRFTSGTTQTVTSFTAAGTVGKVLTIDSTTPATAATLSKTTGTVSVDYLSIQDSTATGGAAWNAGSNSTNVSGNTGWVFTAPPTTSPNFFLLM
jgi:hypothetical protein